MGGRVIKLRETGGGGEGWEGETSYLTSRCLLLSVLRTYFDLKRNLCLMSTFTELGRPSLALTDSNPNPPFFIFP